MSSTPQNAHLHPQLLKKDAFKQQVRKDTCVNYYYYYCFGIKKVGLGP